MPSSSKNAALPTATARPSTRPCTPRPVRDWNCSADGMREPALPGAGGDRRGERMLAASFQAGGQAEQLGLVLAGRRHDGDELAASPR